jgi:5-methylcytosine-specific restriction protein A
MPNKPLKPCSYSGCSELTQGGRCEKHKQKETKAYDTERDQTAGRKFLHSVTWRNERESYLKDNPLCERCLKKEKTVPAVLVHHKDRNQLNRTKENKESLCNACHEDEHKGDRWGRSKSLEPKGN